MRKQLKITSEALNIGISKPTEQEVKKTLEKSFFEKLKDELKKYEYVTSNEYFIKNFNIEKIRTNSNAWNMYRKLKAKAHEVVQIGFEMYKNCEKKQKDIKLEAVIDTYNSIKAKESLQEKDDQVQKSNPQQQDQKNLNWRSEKLAQEKYDHKQMNEIYVTLFFGLQLRSFCDWIFSNLNQQNTDVSTEQEILRKQRHEYFNETVPTFVQKAEQKVYYSDLPNKYKKLVDKISSGYEPNK